MSLSDGTRALAGNLRQTLQVEHMAQLSTSSDGAISAAVKSQRSPMMPHVHMSLSDGTRALAGNLRQTLQVEHMAQLSTSSDGTVAVLAASRCDLCRPCDFPLEGG